MDKPKAPSSIERISGSVVTQSALAAISALSAGPLAALLPILAGSLAAERQKVRVERFLCDITEVLEQHEEEIRNLSDEKYKLINETVLALLQTTEQAKLKYLRAVVANTLSAADFRSQEATVLSRVIRDMSAEEAEYLLGTFEYAGVHLMKPQSGPELLDNILRVDPDSHEALLVSGLMSLGLLVPAEPTWDAPNVLRFSSIVAKLIAILQTPRV